MHQTQTNSSRSIKYSNRTSRATIEKNIDNFRPTYDPYQRNIPSDTRHNYFTRSTPSTFLGQRIIQLPSTSKSSLSIQLPTVSATHFANHVYHHEMGMKLSVDKLLAGPDKRLWTTSLSNEIGQLAQVIGKGRLPNECVKGTNTIFFVHKSQVLTDAKIIHANLICDIKPLKTEKHRVRMMVGGDRLDYDKEPSSPAISLLNTKIFLNIVISDARKDATFSTAGINTITYRVQ